MERERYQQVPQGIYGAAERAFPGSRVSGGAAGDRHLRGGGCPRAGARKGQKGEGSSSQRRREREGHARRSEEAPQPHGLSAGWEEEESGPGRRAVGAPRGRARSHWWRGRPGPAAPAAAARAERGRALRRRGGPGGGGLPAGAGGEAGPAPPARPGRALGPERGGEPEPPRGRYLDGFLQHRHPALPGLRLAEPGARRLRPRLSACPGDGAARPGPCSFKLPATVTGAGGGEGRNEAGRMPRPPEAGGGNTRTARRKYPKTSAERAERLRKTAGEALPSTARRKPCG